MSDRAMLVNASGGKTATDGPVSAALAAELLETVRKNKIVVWLDGQGEYESFADGLLEKHRRGELAYAFSVVRGSFLEWMLACDGMGTGTEMPWSVVYAPYLGDEASLLTPLLGLREVGKRFRKSLGTLVAEAAAGKVKPERIEAYLNSGEVSLQGADVWLGELLAEGTDGFGVQLVGLGAREILEELLNNRGWKRRMVDSTDDAQAAWNQLVTLLGMPSAWKDFVVGLPDRLGEFVGLGAMAWCLCVEYVDDLKRAPVEPHLGFAGPLPRKIKDDCRQITAWLRREYAEVYRQVADETERLLTVEVEAANAEDLGKIDTFRFEEEHVLQAALVALGQKRWLVAADYAGARLRDDSFWVRQDIQRQNTWELLACAARLGLAVDGAPWLGTQGSGEPQTVEMAVQAYVARGSAVDQAHRKLEERRAVLLLPTVVEFDTLRKRLDDMRGVWAVWAEAWAVGFNRLCVAQGFLPKAELRQREVFDQVVRPWASGPTAVAVFLVDALRYEMAVEFCRNFETAGATHWTIEARLAELPTVTEVGMNVLAPVAVGGKLNVAMGTGADVGKILGFVRGEYRVYDPETRRRAMADRVGGAQCPGWSLDDVLRMDSSTLKRAIHKAPLVMVSSRELDEAGETGFGPLVFGTVLQNVKAAWTLLREAGVRRFVFTADHGFLLVDGNGGSGGATMGDVKRRHGFTTVGAAVAGEVRVSGADLEMEGCSGYWRFREGISVYPTRQPVGRFVHGGNSLQERVIPVVTVEHRTAKGATVGDVRLEARKAEPVMGMHRIRLRASQVAQGMLSYVAPKSVGVMVQVKENREVEVEVCQVVGGTLRSGVIELGMEQDVEVFFRLVGSREERVLVELVAESAVSLEAETIGERFDVTAKAGGHRETEGEQDQRWLLEIPEGGPRNVMRHVMTFGMITEEQATVMLGGARAFRRFTLEIDEYRKRAPFEVIQDVVDGMKSYKRDGGSK